MLALCFSVGDMQAEVKAYLWWILRSLLNVDVGPDVLVMKPSVISGFEDRGDVEGEGS